MTKFHKTSYAILIGALCISLASCVFEKANPTQNSNPIATSTPQPNLAQTASTVLFEWSGVPVMPGAISGAQTEIGDYSFTTAVPSEDLIAYYELHMPELGWTQRDDIESGDSVTTLAFQKATDLAYIRIESLGTNTKVTIHVFKVSGPG
jgi:hypothetical protein